MDRNGLFHRKFPGPSKPTLENTTGENMTALYFGSAGKVAKLFCLLINRSMLVQQLQFAVEFLTFSPEN